MRLYTPRGARLLRGRSCVSTDALSECAIWWWGYWLRRAIEHINIWYRQTRNIKVSRQTQIQLYEDIIDYLPTKSTVNKVFRRNTPAEQIQHNVFRNVVLGLCH